MTEPTHGQSRSAAQQGAEAAIDGLGRGGGPFVAAVAATRMPIVITDPSIPDNPIVYANTAFLDLCGYEREEVLGRTYHFLTGPDTDPEVAERIDTAINAHHDITLEVGFQRKDGASIWVSQFVGPVKDAGGRVLQHFASFLDITERKRLEDELRGAHADLERRVRLRTSELEDANRRLREEVDRRHAAEIVLQAALSETEALVRDKEFLIREVNHRVKNTLQRACALLSIQAGHSTDGRVREALSEAGQRLARMAEVHELLHRSGGYQSIDVARYLEALGTSLIDSWQGGDAGSVSLSVESERVTWGPDIVLPLGLIVNEAVGNALKHAFPTGRHGAVAIVLRRGPERTHQLVIRDDGVGIGPQRRNGSLGLTLIDALAEQIDGSATVEAAGGTLVTVTFTTDPRGCAH